MSWKVREYSIYHQNGVKVSFKKLIKYKPIIIWFFPEDEECYQEIVDFSNELSESIESDYQIIGICRSLPGNPNQELANNNPKITLINDFDGALTNIFNVVFFENTKDITRPVIQKSIFLLSNELNIKVEYRSQYQHWNLEMIQKEICNGLKNYNLPIR